MLDPQAKALLERMAKANRPPMHTLSPEQARAEYRGSRRALSPDPPNVASIENHTIVGPHGPIGLRSYRPLGTEDSEILPALVYFHGGGFTIGDLDTHDVVCRSLANGARCAVISIDYRLAPENKFPKAIDDAITAVRWVAENARARHIDPDKIAIGGDSAGGNLSAVTAIVARDAGNPKIRFQILIYPGTHAPHHTRSAERNGQGYSFTRELLDYFRQNYVRSPEDYSDWRCSPLLAPDLSRLPPALIITAGYDPLLDDGKAYAEKLQAAGVPVTYACYEGMIHGFITMGKVLDAANTAIQQCATALRQAFADQSETQ